MKLTRNKYNWLSREEVDSSPSLLRTWGDVAIAGASLVGGYLASSGAQGAADTQAGAAANAQQISQNEFNTITAQQRPFMQSGYGAMNQLDYLLGIGSPDQYNQGGQATNIGGTQAFIPGNINPADPLGPGGGGNIFSGPTTTTTYGPLHAQKTGSDYQPAQGFTSQTTQSGYQPTVNTSLGGFGSLLQPFNAQNWQQLSPAYNFQRQQGMQGVLGADASSAGALSGSAQKDLMSFNQNLANTSFNNAFNMYQTQQGNIYDRLAGVMQLGQSAAANTGQQGTALAGQAAQSATNIGSALAAGQVGAANAYANTASTLGFLPWLSQGNQPAGQVINNGYDTGYTGPGNAYGGYGPNG